MQPGQSHCRFCSLSSREKPLLDDGCTIVVPSVGSLVEGWLLVVPRAHVVALADLEERESFASIAAAAEQLVARTYGPRVLFEHGPAGASRVAGCGVDHAHLHIVATTAELRSGARRVHPVGAALNWRRVDHVWDADREHRAGLDYLYVKERDGDRWLAAHPQIPSQLMRRVIADHISIPVWDWRVNPQAHVGERTRSRMLALVGSRVGAAS